jgi:ribosome-associated protein
VTDQATPSAKPARVRATSPKSATPQPATSTATGSKTAVKPTAAVKPTGATNVVDSAATNGTPAPKPRATRATSASKPRPGLPARAELTGQDRKASLDTARRVVELAEDKKAADIVLLDLGELTTLADAFVICSGGSERQLDAIADGIVSGLREQGVRPIGREGVAASHWVLLDFGGVIVHIFTPPERDFYELEKHWSEARTVLRVQ